MDDRVLLTILEADDTIKEFWEHEEDWHLQNYY
jgi:hypothetical protein